MAYPRAPQTPQAAYGWQGNVLSRQTPAYRRARWESMPVGSRGTMASALGAGSWEYGRPEAIGTRREEGGVSFKQSPSAADIAGAGITGEQAWVGDQPTLAALRAKSISDMQKSIDEAKATNEQRYEEILQGYSGLTDPELTRTEQGLIGRGLYNTSSLGAARRGSAERMKMRKLAFMERRTDAYPDTSQFLALQQQVGRFAPASGGMSVGAGYSGPRQTYARAPTARDRRKMGIHLNPQHYRRYAPAVRRL